MDDAAAEARRTITVVASDLKGSTELSEKLDAEAVREILALYFDAMRLVFESHGGMIHKIVGDAIIVVFGLPTATGDDAAHAVRAAGESRDALALLNERLLRQWSVQLINRTGIATGEVVVGTVGSSELLLTGDVFQSAGRLEQAAPATEVLVAESTFGLVSDLVSVIPEPVLLRGATEPTPAYRLVSISQIADRATTAGAGVVAAAPSRESRKTVTIVFGDLTVASLDGSPPPPVAVQAVMARAFGVAQHALQRHGATVEKFIGDAVMAVFGLPVRHEDDAFRAIRAALELRAGLDMLAESLARDERLLLEVAVGVNTGEVVAGDASTGQRLVTGDAVNTAARLEQSAGPGSILIGEATRALVRDLAELEEVDPLSLKGKAQPVRAFRLVALRSAEAGAGRSQGAMVGRAIEMRSLADAFEATLGDQACHMVTLVGDAGVGKSRLTEEFLATVATRAVVVRGRCLPYGDGITFWPIVEIVASAASIRESDRPKAARRKLDRLIGEPDVTDRVAAAIGLVEAPFQVAELIWGIRRFLEILARKRPLVVVVDDIHWAEETLLELVGGLTSTVESAPVMVLCTARQELVSREPSWAEGPGQTRVDLSPLSDSESTQVIDNLLGRAGLSESVRAKVVSAAEGNPLFVEQLVSMLIDRGLLRLTDDHWESAGNLETIAIPPTINALLAARLDQLPTGERAVIDPASVIGLEFTASAIEALLDADLRPSLPTNLVALETRQLVRPTMPMQEADDGYRFAHLMIRDATYGGLLKRTRASLHERFVAWIDETYGAADRATEVEEITGYHLEQAHRYLAELGQLDDHGAALGIDASARLGSAGERAYVRGDMPAMANLFQRAAMVLPETDARRPRLWFRHGLALWETGEYEAADRALDTAADAAAALGDRALETTVRLERLMTQFYADPSRIEGRVHDRVNEAIAILGELRDDEGLARAWLAMAGVRMVDAQWGAAEQAIERVIEHARRAGDRIFEIRAAPNLAMCAEYGPTPVDEAIRICDGIIANASGDRKVEAISLRALAHMHAMEGKFDLAREEYRRARTMLEELGWRFIAALGSMVSGPVEMLAGDPVAAEAELRLDYEMLDRLGDRNYISTVAGYLAEALFRQGRLEESDTFAAFSAEVADADDVATQVLWRGVTGKLMAERGELEAAERLAREAVDISAGEEDPIDRANALMDLAHVLRLAGEDVEATLAGAEALALYERKGNLVSAATARQFLAQVDEGPTPAARQA